MSWLTRSVGPVAGVLLLLAITAGAVLGEERLGGKVQFGPSISIPAGETIEGNLYLWGGEVSVAGDVTGDVVAAGSRVVVSGRIGGDLLVGAGTVDVPGTVDGDVRIGAGQSTISGPVSGDVMLGTGTAVAAGSVGGDVLLWSGTATVSGPVEGSIIGSAGTYTRTGTVGADEDVRVGGGMPPAAAPVPAQPGDIALDAIRHFIVVVILGALFLWLLPRLARTAERTVRERPLASLGVGLLGIVGFIALWIGLALAVVVLAIVFGVLTLGALVGLDIFAGLVGLAASILVFILIVGFLADAIVGLSLVRLFLRPRADGSELSRGEELGALALGAAVVVALSAIPVIGWIVKLVVMLLGLGALLLAARSGLRREPAAGTVAQAAPV